MIDRTCILILLLTCAAVHADPPVTAPSPSPEAESTTSEQSLTNEELERIRLALPRDLDSRSSRAELWGELLKTAVSSAQLREELAHSKADLFILRKELDELRQFILDHEEFGSDYEEYQRIKEIAERETKRRQAATRRKQLEDERQKNRKGRDEEQQQRSEEELSKIRAEHYARAGFTSIGLDVFIGRSSYFYAPKDSSQPPVVYKPYRFGYKYTTTNNEIDYTQMTISGSILNASPDIRSVGIAITFFDEHGNQIGAEIVQIENARTNIPYPFTAKLEMALNQPFTSSASYVLYSDPATP